jgi:hypothetical protein
VAYKDLCKGDQILYFFVPLASSSDACYDGASTVLPLISCPHTAASQLQVQISYF